MNLKFRRARPEDYQRISELLGQIADIHHKGRPDQFKAGARKYSAETFERICP
jgi:diamine N-acetyltransferase